MEKLKSSELSLLIDKYSRVLVEVRKRIVFTLIVFAVSTVAGFIFYEDIITYMVKFLSLQGINIVFTSPFQFINLAIGCGIASGVVISLPLLVSQILYFLKPALKVKEFKMLVRFLPFSFLLFLIGFVFGTLIMRWQIEIFLSQTISLGIGNVLDISGLLTTVLMTSLLMGIGFQFPIILLLLLRIGLISQNGLSSKRPWVYLFSFTFTLFLPPDSILADILLSLPLIFLFELTLILNRIFDKKH